MVNSTENVVKMKTIVVKKKWELFHIQDFKYQFYQQL